jgi:hypothetical protein
LISSRTIIETALPYYEMELRTPERTLNAYSEAYLTCLLEPVYRPALVAPRVEGLLGAPPPNTVVLPPCQEDRLRSLLSEGFREVLESEEREKPPFESEGFRGFIKAIVTLGRYKPTRPTRGLLYRSAYAYLREVLGIHSIPEIILGGLGWRHVKLYLTWSGRPLVVRVEYMSGGLWKEDRLLTKLAGQARDALSRLAEDALRRGSASTF